MVYAINDMIYAIYDMIYAIYAPLRAIDVMPRVNNENVELLALTRQCQNKRND